VPRVEFPPAMPPTLHVTVEAKFPVPVTLAEHCEVVLVVTEVGVQLTVTAVMVGAVMVMEAVPDLVVSCVLVAVMVTGLVAGTVAGAVYRPAAVMVPSVALPPAMPPALHVTVEAKLPVPVTFAEHCEVPVATTETGAQTTATAVMVGAGAVTVMEAEPDLVESCVLVAAMVTGLVAGTAVGAV